MDRVIFELQFLRKTLSAPISDGRPTDDFLRLNSGYMTTDLCGMDTEMFGERMWYVRGWKQAEIITKCRGHAQSYLGRILSCKDIGSITNEQMITVMDMMSFLLSHALVCQDQRTGVGRGTCYDLLWQLSTVLLMSNKVVDCKTWIKEHSPELKALRSPTGESLLHLAARRICTGLFRSPSKLFVKLLVEEGQMDVNVVNANRDTPLHYLSTKFHFKKDKDIKTSNRTADIIEVCEILINNGAHMDVKNNKGYEASSALSPYFPQWAFNFGLKCLAARAILMHGVRYKKSLPAELISFVEVHKPVSSPNK